MKPMPEKFYLVAGSRRYEYRTDDGQGMTGWVDAGPATDDTLTKIRAGLADTPLWEVRQVAQLVDDLGIHAGQLIFAQLVARMEETDA
jgi:hypothetical protein